MQTNHKLINQDAGNYDKASESEKLESNIIPLSSSAFGRLGSYVGTKGAESADYAGLLLG